MSAQEFIDGLSVIAGLVILEGLLSVDNVLGIAALANDLPEHQQKKAIRLGLAGAYIFRVLALLVATWLISNTWVRWVGAGYLIWLMCSHLTRPHAAEEATADTEDSASETAESASFVEAPPPTAEALNPVAYESGTPASGPAAAVARTTLFAALLQIGFMDLSLSIDNVIAAVSLAPKEPGSQMPIMWPIYAGVLIAILALQAIAPHAMKLLKKYPILEPTAFVLIGYVGGILIFEESYHVITNEDVHIPPYFKFAGILLILWVALLYSADGSVRRLLNPVFRWVKPVMKILSFRWLRPGSARA